MTNPVFYLIHHKTNFTLFIKFGLVAISSDQDIRYPDWRMTHDRSDAAEFGILRAFNNKLIMDMTAYLLV